MLSALLGSVAVLAVGRDRAAGAPVKVLPAGKRGGFGTRGGFIKDCEEERYGVKGTVVDSPKDDVITCLYGDGGRAFCDEKGDNCGYVPPKTREEIPSSPFDGIATSFGGEGGIASPEESNEPSGVSGVAGVDPIANQLPALTPDGRKRRGKRRKK